MNTTPPPVFRVGIIGCGNIFRSHSQAYIDNPDAVLIGFYDRMHTRAEAWYEQIRHFMKLLYQAAQEKQDPIDIIHLHRCEIFQQEAKVYQSLEDLIHDVDVLDICSPTYSHSPYAIWALQQGKGVMVEKPPARVSYETKRIHEICQQSQRYYQINENFIWQVYIKEFHKVIQSGKLGNILSVKVGLGHGGPSWGWQNHFLNPSLSGGGVLSDMGAHAIGAALAILGLEAEIVNIQSLRMNSGTEKERSIQKLDGVNEYYVHRFMVEDEAKIRVWCKSPLQEPHITLDIETSWSKTYKKFSVIGSTGRCELSMDKMKRKIIQITYNNGETEQILIPPQGRDSHQLQILDFFNRLKNDQPPRADSRVAHLIQTIISGAYLSNLKSFETSRNLHKGVKISPADINQFYKSVEKSNVPASILIEELVYKLMQPFTSLYYTPKEKYTQNLNLNFDH